MRCHRRFYAVLSLSAMLVLGACESRQEDGSTQGDLQTTAVVDEVIDGDTLAIATRQRVRLLQIDAPESTRRDECYGAEATTELTELVPARSRITLERDPSLDDRDSYGRLLRYVHRGGVNINRQLVRAGAASVWYYRGQRGRYATQLYKDALFARSHRRGLWGQCPHTRLDVERGVETGYLGSRARQD